MHTKTIDRVRDVLKKQLGAVYEYHRYNEVILVFVLHSTDFDRLYSLKKILKKEPFIFLTEEDIQHGKDVFPLQLLHIKQQSTLVWGKDIFSSLQVDLKDVRTKLEYELRNKNVYLREEFVGISNPKALIPTILPQFVIMLEGLLYLKNTESSEDLVADIALAQKLYEVDLRVFADLMTINKPQKLSLDEVLSIIKRVSRSLSDLSHIINSISV